VSKAVVHIEFRKRFLIKLGLLVVLAFQPLGCAVDSILGLLIASVAACFRSIMHGVGVWCAVAVVQ
jgi:hypothetical protein